MKKRTLEQGESKFELYTGRNLEVLKNIPDNTFHAVVTDPPYEIGFNGNAWDKTKIAESVEFWKEVERVMKPGAFLLSFGSTRKIHRAMVAIEDAGLEIRDTINWIYSQGFPKGEEASRAIEREERKNKEIGGSAEKIKKEVSTFLRGTGISPKEVNEIAGTTMGQNILSKTKPSIPRQEAFEKIKEHLAEKGIGVPIEVEEKVALYNISRKRKTPELSAEEKKRAFYFNVLGTEVKYSSEDSKKHKGKYPSLKPASEPIALARKKIDKTIVNTLKKHGTSCLNVDVCRVETEDKGFVKRSKKAASIKGRFPANIITDGTEVAASFINDLNFEKMQRFFYSAKAQPKDREEGLHEFEVLTNKTVKNDEKKNIHQTVKPTSIMHALIKLVTPDGGLVLDPFNGSGSTGKAVARANRNENKKLSYVGIDLEDHYIDISYKRIKHEIEKKGE